MKTAVITVIAFVCGLEILSIFCRPTSLSFRWYGNVFAAAPIPAAPAGPAGEGERLFVERCAICHQPTGTGVPPIYPPLAGSDWLAANRERAIKALCEGLSEAIEVNGQKYLNTMPAQMLDDAQAAAVLTYVGASWGNKLRPFEAAEVAKVRKTSNFKTYAELTKASAYQPLPKAPDGWTVKEVAQLPEFCTRFAGNGKGDIYVIAGKGNVYRLDPAAGAVELRIKALDYLEPERGDPGTLGLLQDAEGRLWMVCNRQLKDETPIINEITIYRTDKPATEADAKPQLWFRTRYPYGIGPYNHGVSNLAFGPDGMLYVASGSRTDGGEPGKNPQFYQGGEVEITACLWRLDPKAKEPKIEVYARGLRNVYGFAWDGDGRLFTVANGPDANVPEEMDAILPGHHYGFPYQFSNIPVKPGFPYPHTPVAPAGVEFTMPVINLGPAGGGTPQGLSTLEGHSSPAGMVWCGNDFPAPFRGGFFVSRFGNLIGAPAVPDDVGFDVLWMKLQQRPDQLWEAQTEQVFSRLGRPIDIIRSGPGAIWILEYTRSTSFKEKLGWLPGRVLELWANGTGQ
ncbi:MAG TPA: PQQ-dependent sugar dehydrogenase [Chthoniobacteraceae bacterium]|jgi:glucose/arabinose dehydrogenase|nr:PQQ-dependent sugar dehydrogenase [Chthoniobacteraceae bacterium]